MKYRLLALTLVALGCATLVRAQQPLRLQIGGGRVTLHAQNVPVRTILTEWARLGGAKVVNGDRVTGGPVTLDLDNVPERQALDIILRGVSGYMLAAREAGAAGDSMYDRIMILPTSTAPRNPPPAAPVVSNAPAPIVRPVAPRVPDEQEADADPNPDPAAQDADGSPIPRPVATPRAMPIPGGAGQVTPPVAVGPETTPPRAQPGAVVVTRDNPFGLPQGSSSRPGVITPPPAAPTPNTTPN